MNQNVTDSMVNLSEVIAEEHLESVMNKLDVEASEENKEDILALALNMLPSKYVTSDEGKQYARLLEVYRTQYESDVVTALTKASMKVKNAPRKSKKQGERQ